MSYEQGQQAVMDNCYVFIAGEDIKDETAEQKLHDEGGETQNISPQWSANIFSADRNENIISISFHTTDNNAEYEIYVNNLGKIKPSDPGSVVSEPVLSGVIPNAGYNTLSLPTPFELYSGDYYSVIVKMTTLYEFPTAVEGSVEGCFTAFVNNGASYFASGDSVPSVWFDGKSLEGKEYNATIRAITVERVSYETAPVITTASLPAGRAGEQYEYMLEAQGSSPIEWRTGNLPEGFSFSPEGVLSGKSDSAVDEEVRFTAFNNVGSADKVLRLRIEAAENISKDVQIPDEPESPDTPDIPDEPLPEPTESPDIPDIPGTPESPDTPDEPAKILVGSPSGGCEAGFGGVCCAVLVIFLRRRRWGR